MADQSTIGPTLLVLCPLLVGVISIVTRSHRVTDFLAQAVGLVSLLLLIPLSGVVLAEGPVTLNLGGHRAPVAIPLYVDGLSLLALWLTTWIAVAVHAYAAEWLRVTAHPASMEYRMLWPLLWSGLNGLFLSADLFNVYVMLEVTTLGAVSLVIMGREGEAAEAATRYLHFGLIGSVLYLLGVALVYMHVGSLYMPLLPGKVSLTPAMAVALFCMTAGLAMKAALFPVHAWLPLAHASA
ncbi:MAG: proton-conducting transporter membrane subunit, partial [Chloroflexota bacterium]